MAAVIKIKRKVGTGGAPGTLDIGELAYNDPGGTNADHALYVGNGSNVMTLVSRSRQVEIAADQVITGEKSIDIDALKITGGGQTAGDTVRTDGSGNLSWGEGSVSADGVSITGSGTSASPLALAPASQAQVKAGSDNVQAITSFRLREQMGNDAANLDTTAKQVVPAINELMASVVAMTGVIILIGTYDADADIVEPGAGSPFGSAEGPLPAAGPDNLGWYLIVANAGSGTGNAPSGSIAMGDWLLSNGEVWIHFPMNFGVIAASNVSVNPLDSSTATTVQEALEEIFTGGVLEVATDGTSILGTGKTADPLLVGEVDGGTYT